MHIQDAITYLGRIDNMSGQVCQLDTDGKPVLILFDLGCSTCSEVASKNADELGDALVSLRMTMIQPLNPNSQNIMRGFACYKGKTAHTPRKRKPRKTARSASLIFIPSFTSMHLYFGGAP